MATACEDTSIMQIGEIAGVIWRHLDASGPLTVTRLLKEVDAPRDLLMQGLGWLAREEKITMEDKPRSKVVALRCL